MKNSISILIFAVAVFTLTATGRALTPEDLAGTYQGTSTATLANGAVITASVKLTCKSTGQIKTVSVVNGQTGTAKGTYSFASDDVLVGNFPSGEFTAFVKVDGQTLTLTLLVKSATDGSIISEKTTATLIKKL